MADENGGQAVTLKKWSFEGQQSEHQIEIIGHGTGAIAAARPHLRRHIVYRDNAGRDALEALGDAMGEIRAVDQHNGVGLGSHREIRRLAHPR